MNIVKQFYNLQKTIGVILANRVTLLALDKLTMGQNYIISSSTIKWSPVQYLTGSHTGIKHYEECCTIYCTPGMVQDFSVVMGEYDFYHSCTKKDT